jgi:glycerate kinase
MNIIIASDSYKGSLNTNEVAKQIGNGVLKVLKDAQLMYIPMADGGEGTVDAMVACLGGHFEYCEVLDPLGDKVRAKYAVIEGGKAVIEMAEASGLTLIPTENRNILKATTYGTGQLIKAALDKGFKQIYIGIGGSATNDGGIGMAQALGAHFLDRNGKEVGFGGEVLGSIVDIDLSEMDVRLKDTEIIVMSDVTNPLCGPKGASAVYGPQKGATPEQIIQLDDGLMSLTEVINKKYNLEVRDMKGAGAAGGLGMGLVAFTGAKLQSGIDAVLTVAKFREKLEWADLVITGEGRIDGQTINGKVPVGVAKLAAEKNVPVIAIVGSIGTGAEEVYQHNIEAMESCIMAPGTVEDAMEHAKDNLLLATERIMRSITLGMKLCTNPKS